MLTRDDQVYYPAVEILLRLTVEEKTRFIYEVVIVEFCSADSRSKFVDHSNE